MNCQDVHVLLHAYLDDELGAAESLAVARHLAECDACMQRFHAYTRLRGDVRQADLYRPAPAALRPVCRRRRSGSCRSRAWP